MKHADPSQDGHQSPPVFPPVSAGGSCRALQSSAGSGTGGAESFWSRATPWVMPVLRDVLVWVQFSLGGGLGQEQYLRPGRVTGKPTQKGSKWRELRAALPLRKDTEVCASLRRLLGSHKSPSPSPSMPSPGLWRPTAAAGCAGTTFRGEVGWHAAVCHGQEGMRGGDGGLLSVAAQGAASPLSSPVPSPAGASVKCLSPSDPFTYLVIIGFKHSCSSLTRAALSPLAVLTQLF